MTEDQKLAVINRAFGTHYKRGALTRDELRRLYESASISRLNDELDPAGSPAGWE